MSLNIEIRESDSPLVERVWRSHSERVGSFISVAATRCDLVVWKQHGKISIALRGPETQASIAPVPDDTEFFGIILKPGAFIERHTVDRLVNGGVELPPAGDRSFWLQGAAWQYPDFDNAETFVNRLARDGALVRDPVVEAVLAGHPPDLSLRQLQRRFLQATGLSLRAMQQIERARQAAIRLQEGVPVLDVVYDMGYFDQPHLTRWIKRLIGQTPAQLLDPNRSRQMSLLYKTASDF